MGLAGSRNRGCRLLQLEHLPPVEDRRVEWMDVERSLLVTSVDCGSVTAGLLGRTSIRRTGRVVRNGSLRRRNAVRVRRRPSVSQR